MSDSDEVLRSKVAALGMAVATIADGLLDGLNAAGTINRTQANEVRRLIARRLSHIQDHEFDQALIQQLIAFFEVDLPGRSTQ